uniref:Chitinase domain-containing protein 1 n=1 Tax=Panagrellus redivivus TaxID=6233 RepID=A0A7E4V360_PANRE
MRKLIPTICVFLLLVGAVHGTLGPDSKKKTGKKEKKKTGDSSLLPAGDADRFVPDGDTRKKLNEGYGEFSTEERKFTSGASLAYVTPWNNHGYDVAKKAAQKFTHISPVWFQFSESPTGDTTCEITGTHDVDHQWVTAVREANPNIKIVPRFIFHEFSKDFQKFLTSEQYSHRCGQAIVDYILRNGFDGAVIEIWFQVIMSSQGRGGPFVLEIVENWATLFHRVGLEIIVPLTAPLLDETKPIGIATPQQIQSLVRVIDYLSIMTYDYNSETPAGIGPLPWVEANLRYLLNLVGHQNAHKLLLGTNMYGYMYQPKPAPGLIRDFDGLIKDENLRFDWDKIAAEHAIREKTGNIRAYLPSERSIEARLELARKYGVGFAIWEVGQGYNFYFDPL